jgi:hypothetical protein
MSGKNLPLIFVSLIEVFNGFLTASPFLAPKALPNLSFHRLA